MYNNSINCTRGVIMTEVSISDFRKNIKKYTDLVKEEEIKTLMALELV